MQFQEIPGNKDIKEQLISAVKNKRIAHAQLFFGPKGSSKLALSIAYAQYINCINSSEKDSCGKCTNCIKFQKLEHPDLHLVFPVFKTPKTKKPISDYFAKEWRELIIKNPYLHIREWEEHILKSETKNKKCKIYVDEAANVYQKLALKNYEAKYKVILVWGVEEMMVETANKLLKILEEPPEKTIFLLITEKIEKLLPTTVSRTQVIKIKEFKEEEINKYFKNKTEVNKNHISELYRLKKGDLGAIIRATSKENNTDKNLEWFKELMRNSYQNNILKINQWTQKISETGRRNQQVFIDYAIHIIRQCLIFNYTDRKLLSINNTEATFLNKFSPYINNTNIIGIIRKLEETGKNIERNGNPKIIFFELSLSLTKLLTGEKVIQQ